MKKVRIFGAIIALLSASFMGSAIAQNDTEIAVNAEYGTAFVYRGVQLHEANAGFYVLIKHNTWKFSADADKSLENRDFYLDRVVYSVEREVSAFDLPSIYIGFKRYTFANDGETDSTEVYAGKEFDLFDSDVYGFYDIDSETYGVVGSGEYAVDLTERIDAGVSLEAGLLDGDEFASYQYGTVGAFTEYNISDNVSMFGRVLISASSEDNFFDDATEYFRGNPNQLENTGEWVVFGLTISS